jgi:hypothetical protein
MKRLELYAEHLRAEQRCGRARNYDTGDAFTVRIEATREGSDQPSDEELRFAFIDWQMATFPIDIAQYFFLCFPDVTDHAG